jgi:hypothetical protein
MDAKQELRDILEALRNLSLRRPISNFLFNWFPGRSDRWACLTHLPIPYSCPIWTPFTTGLHHGAISARISHGAFITDWIFLQFSISFISQIVRWVKDGERIFYVIP